MKKVDRATNIIYFVLLALLSGCIAPKAIPFDEIHTSVPNNWTTEIPDNDLYTGDWIKVFGDTTLVSIIGQIKANGPDLKSIIFRQKMAYQNAKINGASVFPNVGFQFNGSRNKQNLSGFGFADAFMNLEGESDSSTFNSGQSNQVISFDSETYGLNLNFQWELDVWGRLLNGRKAAFKDFESTSYDLSYLRFSTLVRSAKIYFQNIEAYQQLELAKESFSSLAEIRELVKDRYNKGLRSSLDYRLAQTSVSTSRVLIENRKNQMIILKRQLEILMGDYPSGKLHISKSLPDSLPLIPNTVPGDLLIRRPDIRSLISKIDASGFRVAQAKRNLLPGIGLTGSAGTSTRELEELFNGENSIWNVGLNITNPIFNGGRLKREIEMQKAALEQSKQEFKRGLLISFSEVEQLLNLENSLLVQIKSINDAVQQSGDAYKLSKDRYDKGVTTLESVLNSQRQYNDLRSQYLSIKRQRIENRLSLLLALGGDYEIKKNEIKN
tara:strand:+ start:3929 stop:5416 length:1488 start_codon:yes stop_codon:yes gene_type:complete